MSIMFLGIALVVIIVIIIIVWVANDPNSEESVYQLFHRRSAIVTYFPKQYNGQV